MSDSFNAKNISAFLIEQGAPAETAASIAGLAVASLRSPTPGAAIKKQSVNADFTGYEARLTNGTDEDIYLAYTVKKLGSGFFQHDITITCGELSYGLSNLVHTALDGSAVLPPPVVPAPVAPEEVVEEPVVEEPAAAANEVAEEVAEVVVEDEPEVVETFVEVTEVVEPVADEVAEVVAEDEPEVVEPVVEVAEVEEKEAPAKKKKAKKAE